MRHSIPLWVIALMVLSLVLTPIASADATISPIAAPPSPAPAQLLFVENVGQFPANVRYVAQGGGRSIWLTNDAMWLTVLDGTPSAAAVAGPYAAQVDDHATERSGVSLRFSFPGANPNPKLEALQRLPTRVSYLRGSDAAAWSADVPVWAGVRYVDLYPGVDLELTATSSRFVARSASALSPVRLRVDGAQTVSADSHNLKLTTAAGALTLPLFQSAIAGGLSLSAGAAPAIAGNEISAPFATIAPTANLGLAAPSSFLLYSTFLGGTGTDDSHAIAVDAGGNAYVTGVTYSGDFPTTPGAFSSGLNGGNWDVYVTKLDAAGSAIVYSTYIGGSDLDQGWSIAVDADGNAYITGDTRSIDFPTTISAYDRLANGLEDVFVAKLNSTGTALTFATYVGGSKSDRGAGIAVAGDRTVYVTGYTKGGGFPVSPAAYDQQFNGQTDAFVLRLNSGGSGLLYSTFLGAGQPDYGNAIAVDGNGNAFVIGTTTSVGFPTTAGAYSRQYSGNDDAFIARFSTAGNALLYSTFLGGTESDAGYGIAVDSAGSAYVTGATRSPNFPISATAFDKTCGTDQTCNYNGMYRYDDAFVAKLSGVGSALLYSTFLGGSGQDWGQAIAVDAGGRAYVTGRTLSSNFSVLARSFDTTFNGGISDAFVTRLNAPGSGLQYSTYLGGSGDEAGLGIALDSAGNVYVTGETTSGNFPVSAGAFAASLQGYTDGWVSKLAPKLAYEQRVNSGGAAYTDSSGKVWAADKAYSAGSWGYVGTTGTRTVTLPISGTTMQPLFQTERNAMTSYAFAVPNGVYAVSLLFAEIRWNSAGRRVFDVRIEGVPVLTDFDVWAAAGGRYKAVSYTFTSAVTDGVLNIDFGGKVDVPKVSAIAVIQQ